MRQFSLQVDVKSPLVIRSDHATEGASGTKYIPGSTLQGSLAAAHRLLYPDNHEQFTAFFLEGRIQFPDLLPAYLSQSGSDLHSSLHDSSSLPMYVIPKTAQSCKRYAGFKPVSTKLDDSDPHGVRDSLFDWACFAIGEQSRHAQTMAALEKHLRCSCCDNPLAHFSGYYRRGDAGERVSAKAVTRLRTHTGINPETGTVADGILYNRSVFVEGSRFWGLLKIDGDEDFSDSFETFLDDALGYNLIRMGTGRSRGMGHVTLNLGNIAEDPISFQQHLDAFNQKLSKQLKDYSLAGSEEMYFFAITLHAPLISKDNALRYRGTLDGATLLELLSLTGSVQPTVQLVYQSASVRRVMGWQELWGTPRPYEFAIEAGSVFLYAHPGQPSPEFFTALSTLETQGIGERCTEGFGRVLMSDPFHLEVTQQ